jgi:hypothetical protein
MTYFQLVSGRNKLSAIPKTGGRLYGHQVNRSGYPKGKPAQRIINQFIRLHLLFVITLNKITDRRQR